jgi:hypothetical protein
VGLHSMDWLELLFTVFGFNSIKRLTHSLLLGLVSRIFLS